MKDNDKKMLFGIGIVFLFLATVGFSYAYFSNAIANKDVKDQVVQTGTLELIYTDGPQIIMNNIKPGETITKEISVKNTGTLNTSYNLIWQELINEITNDEMVIEATCTKLNANGVEEGTCENISNTPISSKDIKRNILIESSVTHKYDIKIIFKETNESQNYNQGKKFSGVLGIEEFIPTFGEDTWENIILKVQNNNFDNYHVGDIKELNLGSYGNMKVRIANTSTPSECFTEGFSQTACGFIVEFIDNIVYSPMNSSKTYNDVTYNDGWNMGGWPKTEVYKMLNDTSDSNSIINQFPSVLKEFLINNKTFSVSGYGANDTENILSNDSLFLLSPVEIWGDLSLDSQLSSFDTVKNLTRQLDYYKEKNVTAINYSGAAKNYTYWLRTARNTSISRFFRVNSSGNWATNDPVNTHGVSPAFRIG